MSLSWLWKEKKGEIKLSEEISGTIYIYHGNALQIWIHEWDGKYELYNFFCNEAHLKNCDNDKDGFDWWRDIKHVTFFDWSRNNQIMAKYLAKRNVPFTVNTKSPF